jgi:hypothetical protein
MDERVSVNGFIPDGGGLTGLVMGPVATKVHTMASVPL